MFGLISGVISVFARVLGGLFKFISLIFGKSFEKITFMINVVKADMEREKQIKQHFFKKREEYKLNNEV